MNSDTEIWKTLSEFNQYEVSNYGRLRNLNTGKILNGSRMNSGYWRYDFGVDGIRYSRLAHRLVADAFLDPVIGKPFINHKDGCRTNNHVDNLEWCTNSENIRHAYQVLGNQAHNKIPVRCVETGTVYESACDAERHTGIKNSEINRCCRGKRKSTHGQHWEYAGVAQ